MLLSGEAMKILRYRASVLNSLIKTHKIKKSLAALLVDEVTDDQVLHAIDRGTGPVVMASRISDNWAARHGNYDTLPLREKAGLTPYWSETSQSHKKAVGKFIKEGIRNRTKGRRRNRCGCGK